MQELDTSPARLAVPVPSLKLHYASARQRLPWGPILFRPSRPAWLLLALTVIGATWLTLRHHPWREVARVPSTHTLPNPFTSDGLLVTLDNTHGANHWDPATGKLVRNVLPKLDPVCEYHIVKGGDEILALPAHEPIATFYDGRSGRPLRRVANPTQPNPGQPRIYPDGSRLITDSIRRNLMNFRGPDATFPLMVWDLKEKQASTPPQAVGSLPVAGFAWVSPDGNRILQQAARPTKGYALIDARTLQVIDDRPGADGVRVVNSAVFWTYTYAQSNQNAMYSFDEIRSMKDGSLLHAVSVPSFPPGWRGGQMMTTGDGRYIVMRSGFGPRVGGFPPTPATIQFIDFATGKPAYSHRSSMDGAALFFQPDSSRYLTTDLGSHRLALFDPRHEQPLAIMNGVTLPVLRRYPQFSPRGDTILLGFGESEKVTAIYRRAGWDVPESHLGAIAFPQTWLTAGCFIAAMLVLHQNASRRGLGVSNAPRSIALVMLGLALPVTAYALLAACLDQRRHVVWLAPAGFIVICSIGLAFGSRFWRLANLCLFAAMMPYVLWLIHRVVQAGPKETTLYPLLDRHYQVPHLPVLVALACAAALLGLGIVMLARHGSPADAA